MNKTRIFQLVFVFLLISNLSPLIYPADISTETFSINGFIRDKEARLISNATVRLSGDATDTTTTVGTGYYEFKNLSSGNYSITAEKPGYKFELVEKKFKNLSSDKVNQDFSGVTEGKTFLIDGCLIDNKGYSIKEANVKISGDVSFEGVTADDGYYRFSDLPSGNYVIDVKKHGYDFKPQKRNYKKLENDEEKENYYGKTDIHVSEDEINIARFFEGVETLGWGEYHSAGKCLCCDNILDGDCIIIGNVERTEKMPVPQIIDGLKPWDIYDKKGFFGEIARVDDATKYVTNLYVQINLPEAKQIDKVVAWTYRKDGRSMLDNCELGYLDDFSRIQWVNKIENNKFKDYILFDFKQPITTKQVLLRIFDGKNRLTEVELYTRSIQ